MKKNKINLVIKGALYINIFLYKKITLIKYK